jgi:hypothetical protein
LVKEKVVLHLLMLTIYLSLEAAVEQVELDLAVEEPEAIGLLSQAEQN